MGTDGHRYSFYLLSYVAEVYKVAWQAFGDNLSPVRFTASCLVSAL